MNHEREAVAFVDAVAAAHRASGVWAMFSGGDDSLACALVTSQAEKFRGCVHLDTGIGVDETREFVRETCKAQGWPLLYYRAKDCGQDYEALCIERGFPGPAMHYKMYNRLKERPLRQFIREHKTRLHDRLVLATGARSHESKRRMGHVVPERREGVKVWTNPLHLWRKLQCLDYIASKGVKRSEVVELLHMSGECLCGAFAEPDELKEIRLWYPKTAARIDAIAERVKAAGKHCVWGTRPPSKRLRPVYDEDGEIVDMAIRDSAGRRRVSELCQQCELRFT